MANPGGSVEHYLRLEHITVPRCWSRLCELVKTRIKLGYRYIWEVNDDICSPASASSFCHLCGGAKMHSLWHYVMECELVKEFRPTWLGFYELCEYFIKDEHMEALLWLYPGFAPPGFGPSSKTHR